MKKNKKFMMEQDSKLEESHKVSNYMLRAVTDLSDYIHLYDDKIKKNKTLVGGETHFMEFVIYRLEDLLTDFASEEEFSRIKLK